MIIKYQIQYIQAEPYWSDINIPISTCDGESFDSTIVHHKNSIIELLATGDSGSNADKQDILHGCDMVGVYVYSEKRLYDSATGNYTYYFSEGIDK